MANSKGVGGDRLSGGECQVSVVASTAEIEVFCIPRLVGAAALPQ